MRRKVAGLHSQTGMPTTAPVIEPRTTIRTAPWWNVVLLNDDDHTYEYVVDMLGKVFGHSQEKALQMALEVDTTGRVIVDTTTKERAELKQEQVHAFGSDHRLPGSAGSMTAEIEPVE
jgi:ATP-dependent Clp protease adaptor protein ClpS